MAGKRAKINRNKQLKRHRAHGLARGMWAPESIHMRSAVESAAKRVTLYMHSAARRRAYRQTVGV
jgi:hypothetical protein